MDVVGDVLLCIIAYVTPKCSSIHCVQNQDIQMTPSCANNCVQVYTGYIQVQPDT
eukprot:m.64782 g.64782  ORF g.64782 m.64782 type:complete len:55 (+) comp12026_c0_seq6:2280-2444(+)